MLMGGRVEGRTEMDGCTDVRTGEHIQIDGWIDNWTDGETDR